MTAYRVPENFVDWCAFASTGKHFMNNNPVIVVWVNHPNDTHRNRVYSAYLSDMYDEQDPFINTVPCWMVHHDATF